MGLIQKDENYDDSLYCLQADWLVVLFVMVFVSGSDAGVLNESRSSWVDWRRHHPRYRLERFYSQHACSHCQSALTITVIGSTSGDWPSDNRGKPSP
jgi:hypothetical protein